MDLEEEGLLLATNGTAKSKGAKAPAYTHCLSCGVSVSESYCQNCGQKNDDMRRSLWALIADLLGGIFSFESRMWKTWGGLMFKPGKVAREYADGARTRYSAPIRTYLVVSILFFTFMGLSNTHFMSFEIRPPSQETQQANTLTEQQQTPDNKVGPQDEKSNPDLPPQTEGPVALTFDDYHFKVRFLTPDNDLYKISPQEVDEFLGVVNINSELQQLGSNFYDPQQFFNTLLSNPKRFNSTFNTWLPRAMFIMVPFAMFLGWIFIRGPKALLIDHLILAIYLQSALFIFVLGAVVLSRFIPGTVLALPLFGILTLYFMASLKRMFRRGWFKTIWTTFVGGFMYTLILLFIMTGITGYAFTNLAVSVAT